MQADSKKLIETPDELRIPVELGFDDRIAKWGSGTNIFGFFNDYCILTPRNSKHYEMVKLIINIVANKEHLTPDQRRDFIFVYSEEGRPVDNDSEEFAALSNEIAQLHRHDQHSGMYNARTILAPAGRIWKQYSALSFWDKSSRFDTQDRIELLDKACKHYLGYSIKSFYFEFLDWAGTINPEAFKERTLPSAKISPSVSKLEPSSKKEISDKEMAAILAKAHVEPHNLTPQEKELVKDFRGAAPVARPNRGLAAWNLAAQKLGVPLSIGDSMEVSVT